MTNDQPQVPVSIAPPGFEGLRDFAITELDRARDALKSVGEPAVFIFRIVEAHYAKNSAALRKLLADVEAAIPKGAISIYYLKPADNCGQEIALVRSSFTQTKRKGDGRSRDNMRDSQFIYVGSSRKMHIRIREHLGFCSQSTFALKLSDWYPAADLPLEVVCAAYPAGTSAGIIGALEDSLWERLRPMYGRKGAR